MSDICIACNGPTVLFCKMLGKFDPTKTLKINQTLNYLQCLSCGTIQQSPIPTEKYLSRLVSTEYSKKRDRLEFEISVSNNAKAQHQKMVDEILHYKINGQVLEVGTGIGNLCSLLIKNNIKATGIDISPELVSYAKKNGLPISLKNINVLKSNNKYSVIIMSHVFEHLSDPAIKLRKIYKLLKPRGFFLTAQPTAAMTNILSRMIRLNNLNKESKLSLSYLNFNPWHIVIYSIKGMKILAKNYGFKLIEVIPLPSVKSDGILGMFKIIFSIFNKIGEKLFPERWPFHVAHLFVFKKIK